MILRHIAASPTIRQRGLTRDSTPALEAWILRLTKREPVLYSLARGGSKSIEVVSGVDLARLDEETVRIVESTNATSIDNIIHRTYGGHTSYLKPIRLAFRAD